MARIFFALFAASFFCSSVPAYASSITFSFDQLPRNEIRQDLQSFADANAARESQLRKMFLQAGCTPADLKEERVRRKDPPNIVCELPGSSKSEIIVGAHTVHADVGKGVVDDWSGAALLPALVESLHKAPRRHTFVFIGFTDEEKGLVGSHYYVRHLGRKQVRGIRAMVNLECLGLTPTKVWADRANRLLLADLIMMAKHYHLDLQGVNVERVGDDDTHPFLLRHVPVITIHSVTQDTWSILHSPRDKLAAINFEDYYNPYRLIAAYLAFIGAALPQ